jgi:hypothetical protein
MSHSRAATVSDDSKTIDLQIDPDARLAAAAGGAVRYIAQCAGLEDNATTELQKSIVTACLESFEHLVGQHQYLRVTITRFPDRIEVALAHKSGTAPAVGLDRIAGLADQRGAAGGLGGVDRVQYETRDGLVVTRLTKYLGPGPQIL